MRIFAQISDAFDNLFVDSAVDGWAASATISRGPALPREEGQVQEYLMYAAIAFSLAATLILTR